MGDATEGQREREIRKSETHRRTVRNKQVTDDQNKTSGHGGIGGGAPGQALGRREWRMENGEGCGVGVSAVQHRSGVGVEVEVRGTYYLSMGLVQPPEVDVSRPTEIFGLTCPIEIGTWKRSECWCARLTWIWILRRSPCRRRYRAVRRRVYTVGESRGS